MRPESEQEATGRTQGPPHVPSAFRRWLGQWLERDKVRFVCGAVLGMALLLSAVSFATFDGHATAFGPPLGADFAGFYAAGTVLNEYPPDQLYDFDVQDQTYHRILPGAPPEEKLPYVYPPFFSLLFRPLALLPYAWAYAVWLSLSVGLCLAALALMRTGLAAIPRGEWATILLLALSFEPVVLECWFGGQTSAFGLLALALALYFERLRRQERTGLALALCLYKPTLLLLILPMLAVARRWRILLGFVLGSFGLAGVSLLTVGWNGCLAYLRLLTGFSRLSMGGQPGFPTWKFVDLSSFFKMLLGGPSLLAWALLAVSAAVALPFLARAWWRLDRAGDDHRKRVWAGTLTATLVLNLYVGVYDTAVVVLGALLTVNVLSGPERSIGRALNPTLKAFLIVLYLVPWFSQHVARAMGFQPYTLVLAAFGVYQFLLARGSAGQRLAPT
jgi:alpha-1,2-mannosyltransferase